MAGAGAGRWRVRGSTPGKEEARGATGACGITLGVLLGVRAAAGRVGRSAAARWGRRGAQAWRRFPACAGTVASICTGGGGFWGTWHMPRRCSYGSGWTSILPVTKQSWARKVGHQGHTQTVHMSPHRHFAGPPSTRRAPCTSGWLPCFLSSWAGGSWRASTPGGACTGAAGTGALGRGAVLCIPVPQSRHWVLRAQLVLWAFVIWGGQHG